MRGIVGLTLALVVSGATVLEAASPAPSLRGSAAAMVQQNQVARSHDLDFYRTPAEIRQAVERGDLKKLYGNENYAVADFVRFPYLQPEVHLFVERLAKQYREACGQKLVVTSAVRPTNGQPSNSHRLSVHPAGMAVDLRVSDRASCRNWLESAILNLERQGVLNGIREFHPPHYHIAVFPGPYMEYAAPRIAAEEAAAEAERLAREAAEAEARAAAKLAVSQIPGAATLVADEATGAAATSSEPRAALAGILALAILLPFGLRLVGRRIRRG